MVVAPKKLSGQLAGRLRWLRCAQRQQILACVGEEALASSQQSKLLTWAHNHLLSAYAALVLDALALGVRKPLRKHRINACDDGILALVYAAVCPLVA